jgi:hypothetical protein
MKLTFRLAVLAAFMIPIAPAQTIVFGGNLIENAGAESDPGGDGAAQVPNVARGATDGCDIYAYRTAYQNVNGVAPTDAGNVTFAPSAYLGGT